MGRYVRVDRRRRNPYRLTMRGWGVLAVIVLGLYLESQWAYTLPVALVVLVAVWNWRVHIRPRLAARPARPAMTPGAPLGERHTRHIPQDVKVFVAHRDGGRCRKCGSNKELHYDHVIPWSKGGTATVNNIQLLCGPCNRKKSDRFGGQR